MYNRSRFKKLFIIILSGVIAMNALLALTGCKTAGADVPKKVERLLGEKYGKEFVVTHIGNRFDTGSTTLFCHPSDREDLNFKVVFKPRNDEMTDNYPERAMEVDFDLELKERLSGKDIDIAPYTEFIGFDPDAAPFPADLATFISGSQTDFILSRIAVKTTAVSDADKAQQIIDCLKETSAKYGDIEYVISVFPIAEDKFDECAESLSREVSVNDNWFTEKGCGESVVIRVRSGESDLTAEELLTRFGGEG